jgi:hypothetical protein
MIVDMALSDQARDLLVDCINAERSGTLLVRADVKLVWFCKTLQHWKALAITTREDSNYYELTHNGDTGETYVDVYYKDHQIIVEPISGKATS